MINTRWWSSIAIHWTGWHAIVPIFAFTTLIFDKSPCLESSSSADSFTLQIFAHIRIIARFAEWSMRFFPLHFAIAPHLTQHKTKNLNDTNVVMIIQMAKKSTTTLQNCQLMSNYQSMPLIDCSIETYITIHPIEFICSVLLFCCQWNEAVWCGLIISFCQLNVMKWLNVHSDLWRGSFDGTKHTDRNWHWARKQIVNESVFRPESIEWNATFIATIASHIVYIEHDLQFAKTIDELIRFGVKSLCLFFFLLFFILYYSSVEAIEYMFLFNFSVAFLFTLTHLCPMVLEYVLQFTSVMFNHNYRDDSSSSCVRWVHSNHFSCGDATLIIIIALFMMKFGWCSSKHDQHDIFVFFLFSVKCVTLLRVCSSL